LIELVKLPLTTKRPVLSIVAPVYVLAFCQLPVPP
jgi:hypothetical protein